MVKFTIAGLFREQLSRVPPVLTADLTGKTVMVIGANTGIGLEAAKHFAKMGSSRVILGCRNEEKGKAALATLERETNYRHAELWLIDLGKFSSVVAFVEKFERDGGSLDILVCNAAIATDKYATTSDGWESTVQVNHLSTALLALLLSPHLIRSAKASSGISRLVIVGSELHGFTKFEADVLSAPSMLNKLSNKEYCSRKRVMQARYPHSKLLNLFFTRALAEHLTPTSPVIVSCVNPGYCVSELRRDVKFPLIIVSTIMDMLIGRTAEQGSRQLVWAALGPNQKSYNTDFESTDGLRGAYVSLARVAETSDFVLGEEGRRAQGKLWNETVSILSKVSPKVQEIVAQHLSP